jgi:hypothetical protein
MYAFDFFQRLRAGRPAGSPRLRRAAALGGVPAIAWGLGATSLLTDVSSEAVASVLPLYLVLELQLDPLQFGVIDGVYNGLALALLGLVAGGFADRHRAHRAVAAFGYALSAACKPLLLLTSLGWAWFAWVLAVDRAGKGIRTTPRDALLSLHSPHAALTTAFAAHRALDALGAFAGPLLAFAILALLPGSYDVVWLAAFAFALCGLAVLGLFVPPSPNTGVTTARNDIRPQLLQPALPLLDAGTARLLALAFLLACGSVGDGFLYLALRDRTALPGAYMPLYYVFTSLAFAVLALPMGLVANRIGRVNVLCAGFVLLWLAYVLLLAGWPDAGGGGGWMQALVLVLFGAFHACTDGVLVAMLAARTQAGVRAMGVALLATAVGLGKFASSLAFGWLARDHGDALALSCFAAALPPVVLAAAWLLRRDEVFRGPDVGRPAC